MQLEQEHIDNPKRGIIIVFSGVRISIERFERIVKKLHENGLLLGFHIDQLVETISAVSNASKDMALTANQLAESMEELSRNLTYTIRDIEDARLLEECHYKVWPFRMFIGLVNGIIFQVINPFISCPIRGPPILDYSAN